MLLLSLVPEVILWTVFCYQSQKMGLMFPLTYHLGADVDHAKILDGARHL